ncbi:LPS export ABC transporter permease LptF [Paracoccus aminophilus]|uniref:Permease YjgP/YjgQ family protein n=1 Tax=Paracoccus aminophilus JCM 7686 TaxID=1367847 RepID=S5XKV1_PARAH|nr:LPS export ABC transporter permease LptF [Paracoccus aminophilus]AGT07844.1 permease YjgP/YjgQ family protein [Paracoccus aminophilus JCM 7686]
MARIDRYILSQFLTLFGFFALVLVSVYWINRAVSLFEQLISDGQTAMVVVEFTALTLPLVISVVLPIAAFAASAYGTNRLSSESELVAMQAAGMSPWRLARPVLVYGFLVAIMSAVLVHGLVPAARARMADRQQELAENVTAQFLRPGVFQFPADGLTLYIRDIANDGRMKDLFFQDSRDLKNEKTYSASEAYLIRSDTGPKLLMVQGSVQTLRQTNGRQSLSLTRFTDMTYDLGAVLGPAKTKSRDLRTYSTPALFWPSPELLQATGSTYDKARAEAFERLAKPFLSPVTAMLGFAMLLLGNFSRFGVWKQLIWSVMALIFVQFLDTALTSQVERDASKWPLVWVPALVGAAICLVALWLAARPKCIRKGESA